MFDIAHVRDLQREALEAGFKEQIGVLFKTLVANLIEANAHYGAEMTVDQALAMFVRGMKAAMQAFDKAEKLIASQ